jgi:hypothetical protein
MPAEHMTESTMNKIFALVLSLFFAACAAAAQEPSAPAPVWQHTGSASYEQKMPGLGTSQRYASSAGWIDVYVYDLRRNDWQSGVSDPQFAAHFDSTVDEVRFLAQRGMYADLQVDAVRDVVVSDHLFRTIRFRFSRDGKSMISATYLTAQDGHLLKYRVSLYAESGLDVAAVAESFIAENLRTQGAR